MNLNLNKFRQKKKPSGFTLMELIVVMGIIAILAIITIPDFMSWRRNLYVKSAARDIYSAIQEARLTAVKNNAIAVVIFDPANQRFYLCDSPGTDGTWNGTGDATGNGDNNIVRIHHLAEDTGDVQYGNGNVTGNQSVTGGAFPANGIGYSNNLITLNPQGGAKTGYVYIQNRDGDRIFAVGTESTGLVKLNKWDGGSWQ